MGKGDSGGGAGTAAGNGRESRASGAGAGTPSAPMVRSLKNHLATLNGAPGEHAAADAHVAKLAKLDRPTLHATLKEAGVEGIKASDSKRSMLNRARLRLTAPVRARERQET